jgi:uncharacterized protein YndB with AHSA1/START domain
MSESKFVYVTFIRTTPEKLWQALTDPAFTRRYWCETSSESTWEPGAAWRLMAPSGRVADAGEVVEADKPRRLVLKWQNHLFPHLTAEGFSRCTFHLEPAGDAVKLTVTHEMDRPQSKLIEGVSNGWPPILSSLKSLLETGDALDVTRRWPEGM